MRSFMLLSLLLCSSLAAAAEKGGADEQDPMAGWAPKKAANEAQDRKEIDALVKAMDAAARKGDLQAAAAMVDFPVLMVTDDKKGEASAAEWSKEQWLQVMEPFYKQPLEGKIRHKPTVFLASDSLATLVDVVTMTVGNKSLTSRNSTVLVRKDGKWLVKVMMEGGWGDVASASPKQGQDSATAK